MLIKKIDIGCMVLLSEEENAEECDELEELRREGRTFVFHSGKSDLKELIRSIVENSFK